MQEPLFTREEAEQVLEEVRPYIEVLVIGDPHQEPKGLVVLLFRPGLPISMDWTAQDLNDEVLATLTVGEPDDDCYGIALDKAVSVYRTGLPSHVAAITCPSILQHGSTIWPGAVMYEGCGAAASGISGFNDLAAALAVATRVHTFLLSKVVATQKAGKGYIE